MQPTPLLHVLGAGPWQLETIKRARELGMRVLVTDYLQDRPGYALADCHEIVDITDPEATLAVARRYRVDGILCDTTDTGVKTAAYVADRLALPGVGVAASRVCTDKHRLREAVTIAGLRNPPHALVTDPPPGSPSSAQAAVRAAIQAAEQIGYPLVVKPVDNQSGRGVSIVPTSDALPAAVANAMAYSRTRRVILEAKARGVEHIVDGFVSEGRAQVLGIAAKRPYADNPTISSSIDYLSGADFAAALDLLEPVMSSLLAAASLDFGLFHAELIVDGQAVVPIDLAARGGGVMIYTHALQAISGVDAVGAAVRAAVGWEPQIQVKYRRAGRVEFLRLPAGTVESVVGVERACDVPGVVAVHLAVKPGDRIGPMACKDDRPGFIVAAADDEDGLTSVIRSARSALAARMVGESAYCAFA